MSPFVACDHVSPGRRVVRRPGATEGEECTVTAEAHIIPLDDLIEHESSDDCPCGPTDRPVQRGDGSFAWLAVHHSLDGREQHE